MSASMKREGWMRAVLPVGDIPPEVGWRTWLALIEWFECVSVWEGRREGRGSRAHGSREVDADLLRYSVPLADAAPCGR